MLTEHVNKSVGHPRERPERRHRTVYIDPVPSARVKDPFYDKLAFLVLDTQLLNKKGLSRFSARQLPPVRARQLIEDGAKNALADLTRTKPYVPENPTTIRIELASVDQLAEFKGRPGVEITGPLSVESRAEDWLTAWNQFWPHA